MTPRELSERIHRFFEHVRNLPMRLSLSESGRIGYVENLISVAIAEAVAEERESCAKTVESWGGAPLGHGRQAALAAAIRARGGE